MGSRHVRSRRHSQHGLGRRPIGLSVIVTLGRSSLAHQVEIELCRVTYACDLMCMCVEFRDEILLRGEECETSENPKFWIKDKMVISIEKPEFF